MRRNRVAQYALVTVIALMVLVLSGCDRKSINEIKAEPSRYANKDVAVAGNVTRSYSVLGRGAYEIDDGTGKLWIVSEKGVPRTGAQVVVQGKIRDAFNLSSIVPLPEAISSGMVMIEKDHRAK